LSSSPPFLPFLGPSVKRLRSFLATPPFFPPFFGSGPSPPSRSGFSPSRSGFSPLPSGFLPLGFLPLPLGPLPFFLSASTSASASSSMSFLPLPPF